MDIREEIRDDIAVLTLTGQLMSGPEVAPFHEHVKKLMNGGIVKIVVDFAKVKWMGSSMIGVLTASLTSVRNQGGDIRLAGVADKIESILMVTKLATIFRTLKTVDRAVTSFTTQPPEAAPKES